MNVEKKPMHIAYYITLFFLINLLLFSLNPQASTENLSYMEIDVSNQLISQQNFTVSIYETNISNETSTPYLVGVTIIFNNRSYDISNVDEDGELTLTAPYVEKNSTYKITAVKQGYHNATKNITILAHQMSGDHRLIITPAEFTVDAATTFTVTVYDEMGNPIFGATVGIQQATGQGSVALSDENGHATLTAPNKQKITLIAEKQGYQDATETMIVNTNPDLLGSFLENPYAMIILAGFILVIVIFYVRFKFTTETSKSNKYKVNRIEHNEKNPIPDKNNTIDAHAVRSEVKQPKIEEIRITKKQPQKKVIPLTHQTDTSSLHIKSKEHRTDIYYKGNQSLGYTIDKITKPDHKKRKDKWIEGTTDIQEKIDQALKRKEKKDKQEK